MAEGTDKDGVLVGGKPIERISWDDWTSVEKYLGGSSTTDVTGGMREKVLKLLELTDAGINSFVFNALKRGHISRVLKGEVLGTKVERQ